MLNKLITKETDTDVLNLGNDSHIESVDDPKLNQILFTIYDKLHLPVKSLEEKEKNIEYLQDSVKMHKDIVSPQGFFSLFEEIFLSILKYAVIPLFIVLFITLYVVHDKVNTMAKVIYSILELPCVINGSHLSGVSETIWIIFVDLLLIFIVSLLWSLFEYIDSKHQLKKIEPELAEKISERDNMYSVLAPYLSFVPEAYRTSKAIEFFANSYRKESSVSNLKEAIQLYRQQEHWDKMERYQEETIEHLKEIEFQNLTMMNQLDRIRTDVWVANLLF
ncbi:MAG: hypothetical protein ACI4IE_08255 [Eubacterium sp.]